MIMTKFRPMFRCMFRSISFKNYNGCSLQLNGWFFKLIDVWPQINSSSIVCKRLMLLHIFICVIVLALLMIPCTLFVLFKEADIKLKLNAIAPLLHRVMWSVNYGMLIKRSSNMRKLICHMETDWKIIGSKIAK